MTDPRNLMTEKLSPSRKTLLKQTKIDRLSPGPILANFQTLIDAIGTGMQTTSEYYALPLRVLSELNEMLVDPLPHDLKRPQLRSFPALMGLFMLLRSTGLAVGQAKPKRVVLIDTVMLERWQALNSTEQYFALMASWLFDASWNSVGIGSRWEIGMHSELPRSYLQLTDRITVLEDSRIGILYDIERAVTVSLLHQFGWLRLTYNAEPAPGNAARVRQIERTEFGDAMFNAIFQLRSYDDEDAQKLQANLQVYFPEWKNNLEQSEPESRQGQHTFKVSLGKAWRRIVSPANVDVAQLANTILDAYRFNRDHLYQFELRDTAGRTIVIGGPHLDDADYFAEELPVGDVPLKIGESMTFLYDFGDDWRFQVTLESVDEFNSGKMKTPKVTEKSGAAPKQYDRDDW